MMEEVVEYEGKQDDDQCYFGGFGPRRSFALISSTWKGYSIVTIIISMSINLAPRLRRLYRCRFIMLYALFPHPVIISIHFRPSLVAALISKHKSPSIIIISIITD